MSSGGNPSTTTTSNNAPPQQFLDAYTAVNNQAQNVANTPYQPYTGNIVAPFAPGQIQGMKQINDLTDNGGVQAPYLDAATKSLLNAQTPLWQNVSQFSPDAVSQYESPYTQQVVDATQAQFNNQNAIQQQQVIGDAISKGAFGGDREAVAQAITAGQQQLAQAPVIAGLRNQGYTQALGEFNNQQAAQLGANEANAWLGSQAGALFGNLGSEAQQLGLQGANAQMGVGGMQQGMGQSLLNIPYEQYLAAQAYPFQTTGWLANIAEGLGGASGGNSSTTVPGPSTASQVAGLGLGAAGIAGQAGAFKGLGNSISNAFSSGAAAGVNPDLYASAIGPTIEGGFLGGNRGGSVPDGMVPARAPGGSVPDVSLSVIPQATGLGASPIVTPTSPDAIVPGASGMGASPATHGTMDILKNYGQTSTTVGPKQDSTLGSLIKTAGAIAASVYGTPAAGIAASELNKQYTLATGGKIPHRAVGGMSSSMESPWWERSAASSMSRHGLLSSPVAGRTDQLAISPAAGSYVVPADVVSGLGEGNTLAGANIMQRILDTGPHGLKMPVSSHNHMGPPRPPPAYNESTEHISNTTRYVPNAKGGSVGRASGGMIPRRAVGGYTSLQDFIGRDMSQPIPPLSPTDANTAAVTNAFRSDLARAPTQADLAYFTGQGGPISNQISAIAASPEAQAYQTNQNNTSAITNAFKNDLGRSPSQSDLAYFTGQAGPIANQVNAIAASPEANAFRNAGTGINASMGTGPSQTGLPALDNYLNNIEKGANFTRPTTGGMTPSSPQSIADAVTALLAKQQTAGSPNGNYETNAYSNASPFLQAFANDLASNPQANPQYKTFFADQTSQAPNGGGGMASGGMVPRRADAGYVPGGLGENPGDDVYNLEVTPDPATPPAMEGTPAAVGMAPPGATVGQAAALRANASGIPPAPARMRDTGEPMAQGSGLHRAQADPWLALAEAGFGMAAGRSPHALENIGAGANEGVKRYIQQKQEANKENLQADIWGGRLGVQTDKNDITRQMNAARTEYLQWKADHGDATLDQQANKQAEIVRYHNLTDLWRNGVLDLNTTKAAVSADQGQQKITNAQTNAERMYNLNIQKAQNSDAFKQAQQDLNGMKLNAAARARVDADTRALVGQGMNWKAAQDIVLAREHLAPGAVTTEPTPKAVVKPYGTSAATPMPYPDSPEDAVDGGLYLTNAGPRKWSAKQQGFVVP